VEQDIELGGEQILPALPQMLEQILLVLEESIDHRTAQPSPPRRRFPPLR
jgi:hypothetical protein